MARTPTQNITQKKQTRIREVLGLVTLTVAVFLTLCLVSYNALDPSLTTLSVGTRIQNPGGILGAYFADLMITLWGYGSYVFVGCLFFLAIRFFSQRSSDDAIIEFPWHHVVSYVALIFFGAFLAHIFAGEVELGGRNTDAGGLMGWWLGGRLLRWLGRAGTLMGISVGVFLSLLFIAETSIGAAFKKLGMIVTLSLKWSVEKIQSSFRIGVARMKMRYKDWRISRKEAKSHAAFQRYDDDDSDFDEVEDVELIEDVVKDRQEPEIISFSSDVDGPKILPRADLKEKIDKRKDQLEFLTPKIGSYELPQLSFLDTEAQVVVKVDEESLKLNSKLLEKKLMDYGVEGRIIAIHPGPVITMYEFEPAPGVKVNKIVNLEDDLSLTMGGKSVRIIAPLPGKAAVGIEIPNNNRETVWLKEVIGHTKFQKAESPLTIALGKDTEGIPFVFDLAKMPHLLVAGATGAGKSVQINSTILSMLYKATPEDVRLILIDPKMLELSMYQGIPHLLLPVVTNPKKASMALKWAVSEMERRYELLTKKSARNIAGYNKLVPREEKLPYIVVIIDELADLMMTAAKDVETSVARLAQMARAAGIHLILATQRPSVDVITGLIKANFPARISFKVSSKHDSRTIIDMVGAEHLLGNGDMLFLSSGVLSLLRIHGAYVSETEITRVVDHWKNQGTPNYLDESILTPVESEDENGKVDGDDLSDELYDQAVMIVTDSRQASISMVQRRLRIGYNRAARLIERMEKEGIVGPADGARPREVYPGSVSGTP